MSSIIARRTSSPTASILAISWEVRKPSKKWRNGIRDSRVAAWAMTARSWASWTLEEARSAKPVPLAAITSLWSPKIDRAWVATVRAATWMTAGVSSPAILNMLGSISSRPWDAVKVVDRAPACSAPWTAPAAPPSLCISTTRGTSPQRFGRSLADQASACSPMGDAGVMG